MARILFADDDPATREMVAELLGTAGYSVRLVADGLAALAGIRMDPPDLALLDYMMGRPDGFEVCQQIKEDPRVGHVPILILTGRSEMEERIKGFGAGATDYIAKPFDPRELLGRIGALLRLSEHGRALSPTTGLPSGELIEKEYERRRRVGARFTLCYLDLDHFKSFNDRFGFATGSAVLEALGGTLRSEVSMTKDFAGHVGGDDFVLMCERGTAPNLVEGIQRRVAEELKEVVPAEVVERGTYLGRGRDGFEQDVPLTRLVAAILHLDPETMPSMVTLGEIAADGKARAKMAAETGIFELEVDERVLDRYHAPLAARGRSLGAA